VVGLGGLIPDLVVGLKCWKGELTSFF